MEFEKVIKERCATRKFQDKGIDSTIIEKILEAGRLAPTAKNLQPQIIYVIETKESLEKIKEASPCIYNAPVVLLVCSDKEEAFHKEKYSTYEMDATIVATHMMLAATNLGVDNVWVEMFDANKIKQDFDLHNSIEPICLIPIGYRAEDCPISPNHNIRKNIDEFVQYI